MANGAPAPPHSSPTRVAQKEERGDSGDPWLRAAHFLALVAARKEEMGDPEPFDAFCASSEWRALKGLATETAGAQGPAGAQGAATGA